MDPWLAENKDAVALAVIVFLVLASQVAAFDAACSSHARGPAGSGITNTRPARLVVLWPVISLLDTRCGASGPRQFAPREAWRGLAADGGVSAGLRAGLARVRQVSPCH